MKRSYTAAVYLRMLLVLALLTLSFAPGAAAQTSTEGRELTEESLNEFLEQFFADEHVQPHYIGASVVVVKDGEVIGQEGFGYADQATETAVNPEETVFRVASVSKLFTAVAVMQLVEQGKIDLQEDIRTYLPELQFANPYATPVTVAHLLTHTTGFEIRDPQASDLHEDFARLVEIEDYVHEHMPPVVREPGTSYMYDNFASLLAGLLVEKVSGVPFEEYMQTHLFKPLGMENSSYELSDRMIGQLATGYDQLGGELPLYTVTPTIMPHGGMLSTAEDIGKFMLAFLEGGRTADGEFLSEKSISLMEEYQSSIHPLIPNTTYGFEAPMQLPGAGSSSHVITKAGDLTGFSSYLFMLPDEETGVFLTYNQNGALRELFYSQFMSTFFPQHVAPANFDDFEPLLQEELAAFAGVYQDLRLNILISTVALGEDGALTISDSFLGPRPLIQVEERLFVDSLTNQLIGFEVNEAGDVSYLSEPNLNPLGYAQKGEQPVGFSDISDDHPYADYIFPLQSLAYYPNDAVRAFDPQRPVTRAAFIENILVISNLPGSDTEQLAFNDIAGHPSAGYVQMAYELGLINGDGQGNFRPDEAITRQEAAVMLWRSYREQFPDQLFADIEVTGEVSEWALPAIKMMVAFGYHGPEVTVGDSGADYLATKPLTNEEEAAILWSLLTVPVYMIADELMPDQGGEQEELDPVTEAAMRAASLRIVD
ncbi:beta-lactamase family protein [Alkalihalobacillus oceani]|uniref:beta-lactamase family protein n=1 Tax=Halalkalibacter oceani TaxID=1653776 RepID=UPI0020420D88|nr:beta-lactamase family protein [Halalkalibacter oceani]MCM3759206.1 beta-lactamase family protein [Halalkalibacter oceani]